MTDTHGTHGAPTGELILYETEDGQTRVDCRFADESLWLSQALIADLFGVSVPTINEHLKSVYGSGELVPEATIRKFRIVRTEGTRAAIEALEKTAKNLTDKKSPARRKKEVKRP